MEIFQGDLVVKFVIAFANQNLSEIYHLSLLMARGDYLLKRDSSTKMRTNGYEDLLPQKVNLAHLLLRAFRVSHTFGRVSNMLLSHDYAYC